MTLNLTDTEEVRLLALSAVSGDKLALVSVLGDDTTVGTEVVGGSYARQATAFTGGNPRTNSAAVQFASMPAGDVQGWELWAADGSARKWWGLLGEVTGSIDGSTDTVTSPAHGFAEDDTIVLSHDAGGLTKGTTYYATSITVDTFQVSPAAGEAGIDLTDATGVEFGRLISVDAGTSVNVASGALSLTLD